MDDIRTGMQSKIPGEQSGIEVRHTVCDICCPSFHCGLDVYVKDGRAVKVEGMKEHPVSRGRLCAKGQMNRQYLYREDRLRSPLRRVGPRGGGRFEPISWEEAYGEIGEKVNDIRDKWGPEAVMFYSGYSKWYRPFLHRLANSFGTPNYGTESSNCMFSTFLNWLVTTGYMMCRSDTAHSGIFLGWAFNPYYSRDMAADVVERRKKEGMKVIIVDPRETPAVRRLADIHLRPRVGTDGALALGLAHVLIREKMIDREYIDAYVYGYKEYENYVSYFTPEKTELLTGVPAKQVVEAARMIGKNLPVSICESAAPIAHHQNGFQNYRAIMALSAITGCFDREGGQIPVSFSYNYQAAGLTVREQEFINERKPAFMAPGVGSERFPLWSRFIDEAQTNDLIRQLETGEPYNIRAILGFGLNYRISVGDERLKRAMLEKTDLLVNTELYLSDTCKFCDIVLPVCTSLERSELKVWSGGYIWYTSPVLAPTGEAKSDAEIICDLAKVFKLGDQLLESGPEACYRELIRELPVSLEQLKKASAPIQLPACSMPPGSALKKGLKTKSGKFELYSLAVEECGKRDLMPLPEYVPPATEDRTGGPYFRLCSSPRLPGLLHSRLQGLSWSRTLHPFPTAELHPEDGKMLGIQELDEVEISTKEGSICMRAHLTASVDKGGIYVYHGYPEADINSLIGEGNVDPYSGFPVFRSVRVKVRKKMSEKNAPEKDKDAEEKNAAEK